MYYFGGRYKCEAINYFWVLLQEFTCFNIVSCQSFNWLIKFPKTSSTRLKTILGCIDSIACVKWMFWMFDATIHSSDVAWSQSTIPLSLHLEMILAITFYNWNKVCSMWVNDPSSLWILTPSYALLKPLSSMAVNPLTSMALTFSPWSSF
jgi:hypothetical protein